MVAPFLFTSSCHWAFAFKVNFPSWAKTCLYLYPLNSLARRGCQRKNPFFRIHSVLFYVSLLRHCPVSPVRRVGRGFSLRENEDRRHLSHLLGIVSVCKMLFNIDVIFWQLMSRLITKWIWKPESVNFKMRNY